MRDSDDYLRELVHYCVGLMRERRVDLHNFRAAVEGAQRWDTLHPLDKSMAVCDVVKGAQVSIAWTRH